MENEALVGLAGAGIVWSLVGVFRRTFAIPDRFIPLLALATGIAWNVGLKGAEVSDATWGVAIIFGVLGGLAATGFESGKKNVVDG
ncbi:hypothetical protein LCGC14_2172670 [marine sediment metagenome]|uniref:Holin n=1 Tax=marine sediment metagenome TaxID=412755 RepID=A0A0F9EBR7_9ZZZZ